MKQKGLCYLLILSLVLGIILPCQNVMAASCNIRLSLEKEDIYVGDEFVVTILLEADETISGVEFMLTYDEDALEYIAGSPAVSGGEGTLKISQLDMTTVSQSAKYLIKMKAKKAMTSTIVVDSNATIYNEANAKTMAVRSSNLDIVVQAEKTASKNAQLKSLKLSNGILKPEFSSEVTEYNVIIKEEVTKLIISAIAQDEKAKVQVRGGEQLVPGENEITIIVTAESGDTLSYKVLVDYEEPVTEQTPNETEDIETGFNQEEIEQPVQNLEPITIRTVDANTILTTYASFELKDLDHPAMLPSGYEKTSVVIQGVSITAYTSRKDSDFVLLYACQSGTQPCFYQYDKVEKTIQRFNNQTFLPQKEPVNEEIVSMETQNYKMYAIVMIVFVLLTLLFMVTTIIFFQKSRRRK